MERIKLVKSLMVGSRILAPGTILEHPRGAALVAKGVAVEASEEEASAPGKGKKKGKKKGGGAEAPAE